MRHPKLGQQYLAPPQQDRSMHFACIHIPDFIVQAVARGEPALRRQAVAILDGAAPLLKVVALNPKARQAGLELGMTKLQAAQYPSIEIRQRSPAQEATAHAALKDCAAAFSPGVEETAADTVVLDLAGLERLFRSPEEIASRIAQCAWELGLEAQIALAANLEAAVHAALGFPGITLIPPGAEAERLGGLPVEVLAPAQEMLETLQRWGVRRFRELAALPTLPLSERLGQEGVRLQKLARGRGLRPLVRAEAPLNFEEVMELEHPVELLEPLLFILGRLLDQLCSRLTARVLATNELRLRLELANPEACTTIPEHDAQKIYERTLRLPVPMRDSKIFLKLLQLNLQAYPPPAPVVKVTIAAEPVKPRVAQGGLFLPLSPDPEKLEVTLARLARVVGEGKVGSPELVDTHRPGAFRMGRFNPLDSGHSRGAVSAPPFHPTTLAFRVFRPPLPARVEVRAGCPARVLARSLRGDVVSVAGPWRTSGDWWREGAWEHEEWDVALKNLSIVRSRFSVVAQSFSSAGLQAIDRKICAIKKPAGQGLPSLALYRIYRDLASGNWFVQGSYD